MLAVPLGTSFLLSFLGPHSIRPEGTFRPAVAGTSFGLVVDVDGGDSEIQIDTGLIAMKLGNQRRMFKYIYIYIY